MMDRRYRYSDSSLRFLTLKGEREIPELEDIEEIKEAEAEEGLRDERQISSQDTPANQA